MGKHFARDLELLQRDILRMAVLVEEAISGAVRALHERDAALAQQVITGDKEINEQENHLDEECLKLLALHQPVAVDLRRVATVLKVNTDLERMADLAADIAGGALVLTKHPEVPIPDKTQRLADLTTYLVWHSLDAFATLEARLAIDAWQHHGEVEKCHDEVVADLTQMLHTKPEWLKPGLALFSATRCLKRIGDHGTNIAQAVLFVVEGRIVRHHPEALGERKQDAVRVAQKAGPPNQAPQQTGHADNSSPSSAPLPA